MGYRIYKPGERKGNRTCYVRGTIGGKGYEIATDTTDQGEAERAWITFAADVIKDSASRIRKDPTFRQLAEEYLDARNPRRNERRYINKLKSHFGTKRAGAIKPMDVAKAANSIYRGCSNETKNRQAYTPIAAILHFGAENELIPYKVIRKLPTSEPEMRRPAEGVKDALLAATSDKQHLLLLFLFCQGWRITETLRLHKDHVSLPRQALRCHVTKSKRWKSVPMHPDVFEAMATSQPEESDFWFPWRDRGRVYDWLRPLCKELGIEFTPHMARHEFGSTVQEEGGTDKDLVDVGTWTSTKSTGRYQSPTTAHKRDIIGRVHGRTTKQKRKAND